MLRQQRRQRVLRRRSEAVTALGVIEDPALAVKGTTQRGDMHTQVAVFNDAVGPHPFDQGRLADEVPRRFEQYCENIQGSPAQWQEMFYDNRYSEVDLSGPVPDYIKLSEAMGCVAIRVEDPDEVEAAIEKANSINDRPVVVEFVTESEENVYPMVPGGKSNSDVVVQPFQEKMTARLEDER